MNRISRIFQPLLITPRNAVLKNQDITSKSQQVRDLLRVYLAHDMTEFFLKLMLETGLIRHSGNGTFFILPLLQRSVDKLIKILDSHMSEINGQKLTMPTLTATELWKKSGRLEDAQLSGELIIVKDRHDKMHLLSPVKYD